MNTYKIVTMGNVADMQFILDSLKEHEELRHFGTHGATWWALIEVNQRHESNPEANQPAIVAKLPRLEDLPIEGIQSAVNRMRRELREAEALLATREQLLPTLRATR